MTNYIIIPVVYISWTCYNQDMIIVNVFAGLGNQLFQYAAGLALARKHGVTLKIDRSWFDNISGKTTRRSYTLDNYNISAQVAVPLEAKKLSEPYGVLSRLFRIIRRRLLKMYFVGWDPRIANLPDNTYLDGYFQDERYFMGIADEIRNEFTLKTPLSSEASEWQKQIQLDACSVSIHVRRGDTVIGNPTFGGITEKPYYDNARMEIGRRVPGAHFYVFSDDIQWAKDNLSLPPQTEYVSGKLTDFEELYLMSICKHHIIANSSFSWWGAWLGTNTDAVVIAPDRWVNINAAWYTGIIPDRWTKISIEVA